MKHIIKTIEPFFSDVWNDNKNVEIRFNDRNYQPRDYLIMRLYDLEYGYIDKEIICRVFATRNFPQGLRDGYIMMYFTVLGKYDYT